MSKLHKSPIIFTLLILCIVSVWIAPVFLGIGLLAMEFTEADSDPFEFDEDLYLVDYHASGITYSKNLRSLATLLYVHPASLSRVFSPPRSFYS